MTTIEMRESAELLRASDAEIDDAVRFASPMVLRGLLYQLTGDESLESVGTRIARVGFAEVSAPATPEDARFLRRKAADYLRGYRDAGAGPVHVGPAQRLGRSLELVIGEALDADAVAAYSEELALDPWCRSLKWQAEPDPERLNAFSVTVIGAGMGGLNAALQLKRAGIPYTLIEKNQGVGGTWHENRYPGARVDTASRGYTHLVGVDFPYPDPYCGWAENQKYFDWFADHFDLRKDIRFGVEAVSLTWEDASAQWEILVRDHATQYTLRSNAVITAVGFLNRPQIPEIEGIESFRGASWHTARWPDAVSLKGKRVAVVGTGCTGYQMIPELALEADQVTVFQRTPQWLFPVRGYRSSFPSQSGWLDRNLPLHSNFTRFRNLYSDAFQKIIRIDPEFDDPHACSEGNRQAREASLAFLRSKLSDERLIEAMTPSHPVWSARAVIVDPEYSILDALERDNVTLVTSGIERIGPTGIEDRDGARHEVDVIVYATGFHATEYLYPMTITGRGATRLETLWADGGARAYLGAMIPGFPNLWSLYGPNTNGGMAPAGFHEMVTGYALQCIEQLILNGRRTIEVKTDAYWRYNRLLDEHNARRVWSDPRARNYYWTKHGRSATQNPFTTPEMWRFLRRPDFADLELR